MKKRTLADIAKEEGVLVHQQNSHNSQLTTHNCEIEIKRYLRTTITLTEDVCQILYRESQRRKLAGQPSTHTAIIAEALVKIYRS
jgi:hypothetical protein